MISIVQHIQYLILKHDCVVVPGLGAFVSRHLGASISADGVTLTPPSRELSFNSLLTHDDGLLIGSVTRREGVSYECARAAVEQEVELIQRRLRHEGELSLPRIGRLMLTEHSTIDFTPEELNSIAALPFRGYSEFTLSPLIAPSHSEPEPVLLEVETPVPADTHRPRASFQVLKYAASVAILIGACLTFLTPVSAPEGINFASLRPAVEKSADNTTANLTSQVLADVEKYAGRVILLSQPDPTEATAISYPKNFPTNSDSDNYADPTHRYYVIVASTTSAKEARRYVKAHSSAKRPLRILFKDGRYRVYAASGNDFNAMSAYRTADKSFAAANPDAWVYTLK